MINSVSVESYVRGVVSSEMPHDWPVEAVKAQAVAARSYALAHRRGGGFDVYNDTRDQVYGGISAETPTGDQAVLGTKRQVLLYDGKVAQTFFFSSSGGRTAAITDVFSSAKPIPYLVAVSDPYDTFSPYHTWGPVPVPAATASKLLAIPAVTGLKPVGAGHARAFVVTGRNGDVTVASGEVRRALGLRSTWLTKIGVLSLSRPGGVVARRHGRHAQRPGRPGGRSRPRAAGGHRRLAARPRPHAPARRDVLARGDTLGDHPVPAQRGDDQERDSPDRRRPDMNRFAIALVALALAVPAVATGSTAFVPDDPLLAKQWYLGAIHAFDYWPDVQPDAGARAGGGGRLGHRRGPSGVRRAGSPRPRASSAAGSRTSTATGRSSRA